MLKKNSLLLGFLFLLLFSACSPEEKSDADTPEEGVVVEGTTADRIDSFMSQLADKGFSSSVLVAQGGQVILAKGYGLSNDSLEIPVMPSTVFTIGSITKQFTGAAILKLEMMGKLQADGLMSEYLDNVPEDKQNITLHHLLTHSAGFPGAIGDDFAAVDRDSFIRLAFETPLLFEPGSAYQYSNVGYSLLAAIVEVVSGQGYEAFLHEQLFEPAGMTHTGYVIPDWEAGNLAHGYRRGRHWGTLLDRPWAEDGPYWHLRGNGGILSTSWDMYYWHQALLGEDILSAEAKEKYYARHIEEGEGAGTYYGYGWAIFPTPRGTDLITHNGGNGIFFADILRYLEEDIFIVLATNRSRRGFNDAAFEIAHMILDPSFEPEIPQTAEGKVLSELPDDEKGQTLRNLLEVLAEGNDQDLQAFIENHLAPGMLEMAPMEQHLAIFRQLQQDIGKAGIERIVDYGGRLELTLKPVDADNPLVLMAAFSPQMPGKLVGMGVE